MTTLIVTLYRYQITISTVGLKIPQFSLPLATSIISRAMDIERENFTLGKVVFKELVIRYPSVVNRTARTSLPKCPQYARRAESMTTGSLHRLPLGQKADWTLESLLQWRIKLGVITLHFDPVVLLSSVTVVH